MHLQGFAHTKLYFKFGGLFSPSAFTGECIVADYIPFWGDGPLSRQINKSEISLPWQAHTGLLEEVTLQWNVPAQCRVVRKGKLM